MTYIDDVFNAGGLLSRAVPGYVPRQPQIDYATAVDRAIASGSHLVIEGPTGTGKSLGYSVPAIEAAVRGGRRVMIVTANIALQEQLVTKDLPALAEVLPFKFRYAMLKGKNNYLCLYRYEHAKDGQRLLDQREEQMREEIITWGAMTPDGDKSELPRVPPDHLWRQFSVGPDDCSGKHCAMFDDCHAMRAKARAFEAHVIVTNYHIFFAHLQVKEDTGKELVLPPLDIVIMDEAHEAAEIARDFFGFAIRPGTIRWIGQKLPAKERNLLDSVGGAFFAELDSYRRSKDYSRRLKKAEVVDWRHLHHLLLDAQSRYSQLASEEDDPGERALLKGRGEKGAEVAGWLKDAMQLTDNGLVYYLEGYDNNRACALRAKPIDVSERLNRQLFNAPPNPTTGKPPTVVLTSATLEVDGGFAHVIEELGVGDCDEAAVSSPFDWKNRALLVLPRGMPEPSAPSFQGAVANAVAMSIDQAKGRTLALFTSYRGLNATFDRLDGDCTFKVLKQGELPRTTLVEEFKRNVSSVLLGTDSFWQGIDVPGESLVCLVIDKLPFPTPDDPVLDRLTELDSDWFNKYSLPRAILKMKQGVGRLIRRVGDFGVVVLLDPRLRTKGYGGKVLASLPPMVQADQLRAIGAFLAKFEHAPAQDPVQETA